MFQENNNNNNFNIKVNQTKFNSQGGAKEVYNLQPETLIDFGKEVKFQDKKQDLNRDPYNIENINIENINFKESNEEKKQSTDKINEELYDVFHNNTHNINNNEKINNNNRQPSPTKVQNSSNNEFEDLNNLVFHNNENNNNSSTNNTNSNITNNNGNNKTPTKIKIEKLFNLPYAGNAKDMDAFAIKEICDPIVNKWLGEGGDKKNIRMLLATLHEIFLDEEKWPPVTLGDVLEDKQLRKVYQRSMLTIHPDKIHSEDPRMKYCAEKIFNVITEAYNHVRK